MNEFNEYVVISIDRYENMKDEQARMQSENYYLSQRVRELEVLMLQAYEDDSTEYYGMIRKEILADVLHLNVLDKNENAADIEDVVIGGDVDATDNF